MALKATTLLLRTWKLPFKFLNEGPSGQNNSLFSL